MIRLIRFELKKSLAVSYDLKEIKGLNLNGAQRPIINLTKKSKSKKSKKYLISQQETFGLT